MNMRIDISHEHVQRYFAIAGNQRAEAWTGWTLAAAKATARIASVAVKLAIDAIRRRRLARATIHELSRLSDHTLKDIGLSRASIHAVAREVSASTRRRS